MAAKQKDVDWSGVELHYCAGIRSLKDIGDEYGVSDAGILKRAKRDGWTRDLKAKTKARAEAKVSAAAVSAVVSEQKRANQNELIEANAEILAKADLLNRKDVILALDVSRSQLQEVATLCDPKFHDMLIAVGEMMDKSGRDENGKMVVDKVNELYFYIIGLAGRVKLAKEIAAAFGVYIPMQRKILKLEDDGHRNQTELDALLARINASAE